MVQCSLRSQSPSRGSLVVHHDPHHLLLLWKMLFCPSHLCRTTTNLQMLKPGSSVHLPAEGFATVWYMMSDELLILNITYIRTSAPGLSEKRNQRAPSVNYLALYTTSSMSIHARRFWWISIKMSRFAQQYRFLKVFLKCWKIIYIDGEEFHKVYERI